MGYILHGNVIVMKVNHDQEPVQSEPRFNPKKPECETTQSRTSNLTTVQLLELSPGEIKTCNLQL